MKRQETFVKMFDAGISYERYVELTLNEKIKDRMSRHFEAAQELISKIEPQKLTRINRKMKILCVSENWCGDCANGVPVISALADALNNWEFVIVVKTSFEEDFQQYYCTAGRQKIPMVILADEDGDEISRWVERPTRSYLLLANLQSQNLIYMVSWGSNCTILVVQVNLHS